MKGSIARIVINLPKRSLTTASASINDNELQKCKAKPYSEVPSGSMLKNMWEMMKDPSKKERIDKVIEEWFNEKGPIIKMSIPGAADRVFVREPEHMQLVLQHDGKNPIEPGFDHIVYYRNKIKKDIFYDTAGLVGSHGEDWYNVRSKVQQDMLRPKSATFYIKDIEQISEDLNNLITETVDCNNEVEDLLDLVNRWSLESIIAIFLDMRIHCLNKDLPENSDAKRFVNAVKIALGPDGNEMSGGIPIWKYITTPTYKRFDEASMIVHQISKKYVEEAMNNQEKFEDKSYDELSLLQKLIRRCGRNSQIPLVMSQDAIMAGVDTTGSTAAFFLLDFARNPEKQEMLFQEIDSVIGDGQVTESKLNQMKYLKAYLHESQRYNPAVFGFSRTSQTDMVIGGYQIPKGVWISYCIMLSMRNPKQFPEPEKFLPERWLRGCPAHHSAHPFATLIFSHGPRMCIGRRFAELECYILAIKILQRYRLEYHYEDIGVRTEFVNKPNKKIKMRFIPRVKAF